MFRYMLVIVGSCFLVGSWLAHSKSDVAFSVWHGLQSVTYPIHSEKDHVKPVIGYNMVNLQSYDNFIVLQVHHVV